MAETYWFVGASYDRTHDQTPRFLAEGIWENGYDESPLTGAGAHRAPSLLFPMEAVFEAFVAKHLARQLGQKVGWGVGDDFDHFWAKAGLPMDG
ncbi:5-methylcytosine restriction system specificity protein McrC [Candidatus Igneacidithiobacillus taiwanensis]|uniref:5-methylcytosine restriction system specificity protein McrC n=1 Tax=Candidatus Igneacidithiobacillus taiwanensis TaxID=1945924 RepID=UPI0028A2AE7E|nr:hypothetical protein [Candidatus Igneacidithiobacillus taiwanensis]MCE5360429.1 hypothetical protein [Acidithiobacillus sp.]